jgi:hypothetical protein
VKECPACGYAMDDFDQTCRRCENRKQNPAEHSPRSHPAAATKQPSRLGWSMVLFCLVVLIVSALVLRSRRPSPRPPAESELPPSEVAPTTRAPAAPMAVQPAPATAGPQNVAPVVDERKQFQDAAKAELARQEEHARQVRQRSAAGLQPMYPARTQPPGQEWVPAGQTNGHWQYVGREPGSGDDSWVWVDSTGRRVGGPVSIRPSQ